MTATALHEEDSISVVPLGHVIGAEVHGLDLTKPQSEEVVREIEMSLAAHCVLFISDQDINIQQFEAFGRQFGAIYAQSLGFGGIAPDTEGITVLDAPAFRGKGDGWHVDELWTDHPPRFAMLRAMELPQEGGDTAWASMYAAYEELSTPMKQFLEPLSAEYTADGVGRGAIRRIQLLGDDQSEEARIKRERFAAVLQKTQAMRPVRHPLVRVHPISGRKHLFFSRNAIERVVDLTEAESNAVLNFLFRHVESMQFQYRNQWSVGKIAMWDERCAQHTPVADYEGRRIIWRCYVS